MERAKNPTTVLLPIACGILCGEMKTFVVTFDSRTVIGADIGQ
jgi:hypothetical protein